MDGAVSKAFVELSSDALKGKPRRVSRLVRGQAWAGIAVSIGMHAVLAFALPNVHKQDSYRAAPASLVSFTIESVNPVRAPSPVVYANHENPLPPRVRSVKRAPIAAPHVETPVPVAETKVAIVEEVPSTSTDAVVAPSSAAVASTAQETHDGGQSGRADARFGKSATGSSVNVDALLASYRKRVHASLGAISYPRSLRSLNFEGVVDVGITIDAKGRILRVRVKHSSGHPRLDEAAMTGVQEALPTAPPPPVLLAWTVRELSLPVRFRRAMP